ncbi:MAG TPA: dihydrolipoamide acetyltransferase family protein [Jiangellaceae bacterium]
MTSDNDPVIIGSSRAMQPESADDQQVFRLPDLGEGLTEAEILSWRVTEGETVGVDDIVVEVETAKAAVEVPCPYAGTVASLHGAPGDMIAVGEPLLTIVPLDDPAARAAEVVRTEERAGSGAVLVGYGTGSSSRSAGRAARRARRGVAPAGANGSAHATASPKAPSPPRSSGSPELPAATAAPRVISPVVRRLARDRGLNLAELSGSGPAGVILRRDVEAALSAPPATQVPDARATGELAEQRVPLRGVRRMIADKMSTSRREIPEVTVWVDVDATGLIEAREALRASHPNVGLMALLARFVVAGLTRYPELNASVDGDEIVQHGHVNLGFAAQTDRGLVVPVVKNAHHKTTVQLGEEISRLTNAARDGKVEPGELTGGTVTLNNYGVFGVDGSTPIINHPEAALIGVGRIVDKPWVVDGQLAVRKVTQLSLTFDHRVCDGGTAGGYLRYIADCVERPLGLLADL